MTNEKLWGGRFKTPNAKIVEKYNASIAFDRLLAFDDILGSLAHATMLNANSLINQHEKEQLIYGLVAIAKQIKADDLSLSTADEDIHMNIERQLAYHIGGEIAGKLHTARSRNDQVSLDMHLYLRRQTLHITSLLLQLQKALIALVDRYPKLIMPGFTHLQHAQPIYFAEHIYAYAFMMQRDVERVQQVFQMTNCSPLGACALAGSTLTIDAQFTAQLLGFNHIYPNTMDAVSDRDFLLDFLSAAAISMMHISRMSEEIILWSTSEFNFMAMSDAFCTGSSIMPQKKNPDVPELARGKTGRVYGNLLALLTVMKGLPLAYNKDLQEDKEPVFDTAATWQKTLAVMCALIPEIVMNEARLTAVSQDGFLNATAVAEYLVKIGHPFREAHHITGQMVAYCIDQQKTLTQLTLEEINHFTPLATQAIYQCMSLEIIFQNKAERCSQQTSILQNKIEKTEDWLKKENEKLQQVYQRFDMTDYFL